MAITLTAIEYLMLGLAALAVVLFCWLGVECRRGSAQRSAGHRRTVLGKTNPHPHVRSWPT